MLDPTASGPLRVSKRREYIVEKRDVTSYHGQMPTRMDVTAATKDSPFFRLDEKLRKRIYAYALTYRDPTSVRKHSATTSWYDEERACLVRDFWRFTPGLLRTCCRLHQEAGPIFYASNTFKGTIRNSDVSEITGWVDDTDPAHLREVRDFIIVIEPTSFMDILDMSTTEDGFEICKQARVLVTALAKTSIESPKIALPVLRHMNREAKFNEFEVEDPEQVRSRWVLEIGSAFKEVYECEGEDGDEHACLVKKMKALMGKVKKGGGTGYAKGCGG